MAEVINIARTRAVAMPREAPEPGQITKAAVTVCAAVEALAAATAALNAATANYFEQDGRPAWIRLNGTPCLPSSNDLRAVCLAHLAFSQIIQPDKADKEWIAGVLASLSAGVVP